MKKTLLTLTAVLVAVISMNAQDLYLTIDGEAVGDTVEVWGNPDTTEIVFLAHLFNGTDANMNIVAKRTQIDTVPATSNYFCWGACFPDFVDESEEVEIVPGLNTEEFSAHYRPQGQIGTSFVEYLFTNRDNSEQNVKVVIKFWASPMGVSEDVMTGGSISDIYPNPATTAVNINFDMPSTVNTAKVQLINLLGSVVKEVNIEPNSSNLSMDISELKGGVYFYAVVINGDVYKTRKLLVK